MSADRLCQQRDDDASAPPDEAQLAELAASWRALGVEVSAAAFASYLAARRARVGPGPRLRLSDLYLACACRDGHARAIACFEARFYPPARRLLARSRIPDAVIDDVVSGLSARLFTALDGAAPLVDSYSGRGELGAWVRSVALKSALKVLRRDGRHLPFEAAHEQAGDVPLADPELVYMRELYAAKLGAVLTAAFAALAREERAVLRQYYRYRLTIDDLGRLHGIHRVSAARRVKRAREALVQQVRERVTAELSIGDASLASILRLVGSRLSVERLLRTTHAGSQVG